MAARLQSAMTSFVGIEKSSPDGPPFVLVPRPHSSRPKATFHMNTKFKFAALIMLMMGLLANRAAAQVTITDEAEYAVAFVIVEKK